MTVFSIKPGDVPKAESVVSSAGEAVRERTVGVSWSLCISGVGPVSSLSMGDSDHGRQVGREREVGDEG